MKFTLVAVCVWVVFGLAYAVNIDQACADDDACTPANSYCSMEFVNCEKGTCKCIDAYTPNGAKTQCLENKDIDATCSSSTICLYGATCQSGTCKCSADSEFNTKLGMCVPKGKKAISETCSVTTDCFSGGTCTESTKECTCMDGYITENYRCRKPHVTESCTASVGCEKQYNLGDASQQTETCEGNTCTCPSTSDYVPETLQGVLYKLCYTKYTQTKKEYGATCTANNQCKSTVCDTCPGESNKICVQVANDSVEVRATYLMCTMVATFALWITL